MDVFGFAIQMETDGEGYYMKQAQKYADNGLKSIFLMLAEDEKRHADILRSKSEEAAYSLAASQTLAGARNIFKGLDDFKSEIQAIPSQLDAYEMALEMEKKSMDMYRDYLSKAADQSSREIFSYLASQEQDHHAVIQELVDAVRNAQSGWSS